MAIMTEPAALWQVKLSFGPSPASHESCCLPVDNDMGLDNFLIKLDSPLVVVQMNEFIPKTIPLNKPADGGEPVSSGSTLRSRVQAPGYFSFHPARITRRFFESGTCKLRVWVLFQKYVTTQVWKIQTDREHSTVEKWWYVLVMLVNW